MTDLHLDAMSHSDNLRNHENENPTQCKRIYLGRIIGRHRHHDGTRDTRICHVGENDQKRPDGKISEQYETDFRYDVGLFGGQQ